MCSRNNRNGFAQPKLLIGIAVFLVILIAAALWGLQVWHGQQLKQAESLLAALREEQEQHCVFHKHYSMDVKEFPGLVPAEENRHFKYVFKPTGIEVHRKGRHSYILKMPSYEDGRICCEDVRQCRKLKGRYPSCSDLTSRADFMSGDDFASGRTHPQCVGPAVRRCGCQEKGIQQRVCNPETNQWSAWGKCSIAQGCDCSAISGVQPSDQTQVCNGCGVQTRSYVCDVSSGRWKPGAWSPCSRAPGECASVDRMLPVEQSI